MKESRIIVALDFADQQSALACARSLDPALCRVKVGKELFTASGPAIVDALSSLGFEIFLDLKFHDIPATVAKACQAAARLGVWMVNVHAMGGGRMLSAAREALDTFQNRPLLTAVTVLTSMSQEELPAIGLHGEIEQHVLNLAKLAQENGADGVVCSAREAARLRLACGNDFCLVTPGIRPADSAKNDQVRTLTPRDALNNGSDYLVIGRPITQAENPRVALESIHRDLMRD